MASDLFGWRDAEEAAEVAAEAELRREEARARYKFSPHGEVRIRLQRLQEATAEALRAETVLRRTRRAERQSR